MAARESDSGIADDPDSGLVMQLLLSTILGSGPIGHPESASATMELEYWHRPKYDDDILRLAFDGMSNGS